MPTIEDKIIDKLTDTNRTAQDLLMHLDCRPAELFRAIEAMLQRDRLETVQDGDLKKLKLKTRKAPKK